MALAASRPLGKAAGMNDLPAATSVSDWCCVRLDRSGDVPQLVVRERVRLSDTDSSGLIYYGAVTGWLTRAQAELWLALGFRQQGLAPSPMMPVVNANLSYHAPLQLADEYELLAWVAEAGTTSLTVGFEAAKQGVRCVSALMTHVHLDPATMRPSPLPDAMIAAARSRRS